MSDGQIIALINVAGLVLVAMIGLWTNIRLSKVSKAVNGLTNSRIEAETALGVERANVARHEGGEAERSKGEAKAELLAAEQREPTK